MAEYATENSTHSSGEPVASGVNTLLNGIAPTETENNTLRGNNSIANPEIPEGTDISEPTVLPEKALAMSTHDPAATVVSHTGKGDAEGSSQRKQSANRSLARETKSITLRHQDGDEFVLPLALCLTQKDMEDLIKLSYGDDEKAKKEIDEGNYELLTANGARILPHFWDKLVEPGWEVTIRLKSQKGSNSNLPYDSDYSDDSSDMEDESKKDKENPETSYTTTLKYTVATYVNEYGREIIFLYSQSYDEPVALDKKAREFPILEEIQAIVVPRSRIWRGLGRTAPKGKPSLGLGDTIGQKSLRIHSPFLLNALKSIIKYSSKAPSGENTDTSSDGEFPHPYEDLFHHRQELFDYKKDITGPQANHTPEYNAECDRHIDFLLEYLDQEPNVRIKALEAMWAKKIPTTTFAGFWLLMKPGSDVYVEEDGQLNAYVVDMVSGGVDYLSPSQWSISVQGYSVRVWYLKYDGKTIGRASKIVHVPVFDNEREILSLPIFPTRFRDNIDGGARRKELIERGRKAFQLAKGPTYLEYTGSGLKPGWKQYNQARVVVEHESQPWTKEEPGASYRSLFESEGERATSERAIIRKPINIKAVNRGVTEEEPIGERARAPCCKCSKCRDIDTAAQKYISAAFSDYDNIDPKEVSELSEHQYMIYLSHVFGFILKDRAYDILDIGGLTEVKIVKDAIDRLVMRPETNKDTIKAIVKTYTDSGQAGHFNADFIQGKGEGQIFLLHGPPGTGKTLTAESVAEYTRRPLLSITAADLGHEPQELEQNLLRFLKNASNWDAVVLLDEADVYLERRSANDLRRNSIVSIFLRAMEYFQGILFLTTNRVGHFDEAFMSRIHVSIGYEPLDEDARGKIWHNLFEKLKEDHKNGGPEIRYEYDAKQYVKKDPAVKNLQWNGREIRNAFQTAVALAIFDSNISGEKGASDQDSIPEIKEKHLTQVVNMSTAFKKYITATHEGIGDADMAYRLGNRLDRLVSEAGGSSG
ncbi:hypothetical protein GGR58DRAFT_323861 [Xylaria digitata]|nr:hypothetical protein GGR58DRAFT_323861 [Xylaria digitata]